MQRPKTSLELYLLLLALCCPRCPASGIQAAQDPAYTLLSEAYDELRRKEYEGAVKKFRGVLEMDPARVVVYRELGYTLLKMGETEQAIEAFENYGRARPEDFHNILELAYLYYQTKRQDKALEFFALAQKAPDTKAAAEARRVYEAIEQKMAGDIARGQQAVEADPANADAREALAEAYARHREPQKAIEQYRILRRQAPSRYRHLETLARLHEKMGDLETANAYYLLAWRAPEPAVAAMGREGLKNRYPFGPEFEKALELEPDQGHVRRELAYLYLELHRPADAARHLERVLEGDSQDYQSLLQLALLWKELGRREATVGALERVRREAPRELVQKAAAILDSLATRPPESPPPQEEPQAQIRRHRELAFANLRKSYLKAAAQEFEAVYRLDQSDYEAMLQLGYIHNMLKKDEIALEWFRRARSSTDAKVAAEARRAVHNLSLPFRKTSTTLWANPFGTSRLETLLGYGQLKTEFRVASLPFRPYLSLRFVGDSRRRSNDRVPQILSENNLVFAVGVGRPIGKKLWAWAEAGNAVSLLGERPRGIQRSEPDYRGGLAFYRSRGPSLFQEERGFFLDITGDAVYLSRFGHNVVFYTQDKAGYQLPSRKGFHHQAFLALNLAADARGDYYNNLVEFGPGYRFGFKRLKGLYAYLLLLRGVYTTQGRRWRNYLHGPNFNDVRIALWYSRSF